MGTFVKVAKASDIQEGAGKVIQAQGNAIAVFKVGHEFHAIDNTCKHQGGPLGEGELDGSEVTCPWHGWQYDVKTGDCLTDPSVSQKKYNVKLEGEDVLVEI